MYFYFTDHWTLISRWINPAIPLFIHSIRNMLFSFSSGSRMYRMIQTPLPALYFHRIRQITLFKRFVLNLNFIKAKRAAQANIYCNPPTPHLHCRKPTVGRTSFTSKCDWPWVSDNAAPLNFKKKKEKCSETKQQQKKRKGKKREKWLYIIVLEHTDLV